MSIFDTKFNKDSFSENEKDTMNDSYESKSKELDIYIKKYNGLSFNNGLLRYHNPQNIKKWTEFFKINFPRYQSICCFAYDWLGRQFVYNSKSNHILILEPCSLLVLNTECSPSKFHEEELIQDTDSAVAQSLFNQWIESGKPAPKMQECISFKVPQFLGGKIDIENMELSNMEVYWELMVQINHQI